MKTNVVKIMVQISRPVYYDKLKLYLHTLPFIYTVRYSPMMYLLMLANTNIARIAASIMIIQGVNIQAKNCLLFLVHNRENLENFQIVLMFSAGGLIFHDWIND